MNRTYRFRSVSIMALLLANSAAWAQSSKPATEESVSGDDIVVTATRREGTVLAAPLSLTAIGNQELTKTGATSVTQIADRVPGLTFATLGPNANRFFIRGIGFVKKVEDLEKIVVKETQGTPIFVSNVAKVTLGPEFRRGALDP